MTIRNNIAAARSALAKVGAHPMAAKVKRDISHLLVIYPPGYQLDGVRVSMVNGIEWACDQALIRMERAWRQECFA